MYKASMRAAPRVRAALRSSPEREALRNIRNERREAADDTVGEPIYSDRYAQLAEAVEIIENHELVRHFGFAADALIGSDGNALGTDHLAVIVAACKAADQLANLAGDGEVCKILGWKGQSPQKLSGFGVDRLFRNAGALQARVAEIVEARKPKVAPKAITKVVSVKPTIVLPTRQSASRSAPAPVTLVVPSAKPVDSDGFGRVKTDSGLAFKCVCGCGGLVLESAAVVPPIGAMRDRQCGSRVGSKDLWRHAFGERCIIRFGRWFSLKETMRTMMDAECKREAASRTLRPRMGDVVGHGGAFGGSGNGAPQVQLAKRAARAEKDRQIRLAVAASGGSKGK
ncbi:MAG: hypothetical protein WC654_01855 [Patescibacteria group bacterium]